MQKTRFLPGLTTLLLTVAIAAATASADAVAQRGQNQGQEKKQSRQDSGLSPQQAAARAQSRHGGKVLKVSRQGNGYSVRLLLDNGRVITVSVKD